ncbi:MAG: exodeoxyribonuclease V subunit alpha, partial [Deltaproteobacteria bacterium]|nr:exodeoxyribonuclease V subunit alpha [Deltaproteobacteria bacterium]
MYRLYENGILSALDIHFSSFISRLVGGHVPELSLAAALVSSYTRQGHVCLDLSSVEGKELLKGENGIDPVVCPELNTWCKQLRKTGVVGNPGEYKPLILDDRSRLYLFRYWDYQERLADLITRRLSDTTVKSDIGILKEELTRLFPSEQVKDINWQRVAAFTALIKRFCVISGGPGTGKTSIVTAILGLLLKQAKPERLRIALIAPTGKAAAKLQKAIRSMKIKLSCPDSIKEAIPEEASTIHRLLGYIPNSPYFHYNAKNTLPVDVVVVDEASMVDLALMSKLIQALPLQARIILLGDKDQLASVEAGAVLGDICDTGAEHSFSQEFSKDCKEITGYTIHTQKNGASESEIRDCIIQLEKNYRFGSDSGIGAVSCAVNTGDSDRAIELMKGQKYGDISWKNLPQPKDLTQVIKAAVTQGYGDYLRASDPFEVFQVFERFRILCALREGPYGVIAINYLVEQILKGEGLINPDRRWYPGRPVLITRNDYNLQLFNGDMGIVLSDPSVNNELRVFFYSTDGAFKKFHPLQLPEHETVYAMTVHKSQGSEFDKALLVLPDRESPVLTRELIYTGITRAKKSVEIWANERVFRFAVSRHIERTSGLRDALWSK